LNNFVAWCLCGKIFKPLSHKDSKNQQGHLLTDLKLNYTTILID
jgi:hypothetical protein